MSPDLQNGPASPVDRGGWLQRVVRAVTTIEKVLAVIAVSMIFVLILIQVAQRYLPVEGWAWTGELARFSLVWLAFVAAGVLVSSDGHIALQVLDNLPSPMLVRSIHVIAHVLVALIAALFVRECWALIVGPGDLRSPSLRMPMAWLYVPPLLGFVSSVVRSLAAAAMVARHGVPTDHDDLSALGAEGEVPA